MLDAPMQRFASRGASVGLLLLITMAACTPAPVIQEARGTAEAVPGSFPAFAANFDNSSGDVFLILVHGVGETCPMYGLDPTHGWLKDDVTRMLGLAPAGPASQPLLIYDQSNLMAGKVDPSSGVYLTRRSFTFRRSDGTSVNVRAAEITWSGLTAWVKQKQLGEDFSKKVPAGARPPIISCPGIDQALYPFRREYVNRLIKEDMLDLALSDAVLYVGSYGAKIEKGVAEVLCRLVSANEYNGVQQCDWNSASPASKNARFIFMTHSLGSRIIYDTLLELSGQPMRAGDEIFSSEYLLSAEPVSNEIIANTRAVYMFANQIPLLGLADLPVTARSDEPLAPAAAAASVRERARAGALHGGARADRGTARCSHSLLCFAAARSGLREHGQRETEVLEFVAFSDANDLLSYSIPSWYAVDTKDFNLRITNVIVQVDMHWFGLVESPTGAHDDYFIRDVVWNTVRCGASMGRIAC